MDLRRDWLVRRRSELLERWVLIPASDRMDLMVQIMDIEEQLNSLPEPARQGSWSR